MREQKSLWLLLALNIGLAGAFLTYLFLSAGKPANFSAPSPALAPPQQSVSTVKQFTWADVESQEYGHYLENLRAAGCPEARIRQIILSDSDDFIAQKRLQLALSFDVEWWHDEPMDSAIEFLQEEGQFLENQRRELIQKLAGATAAETETQSTSYWKNIQLTGLVLGSLPPAIHQQVQEICARSVEQQDTLGWNHVHEYQPIPAVELARLRDQARAELRKILSTAQLEEFLLRFSRNAQELRAELRAFDPTAEEFRKIFRAIDPLEHQLQQQYGEVEALSKKQQGRYERQREEAIREALRPERFQTYLSSKSRLSLSPMLLP